MNIINSLREIRERMERSKVKLDEALDELEGAIPDGGPGDKTPSKNVTHENLSKRERELFKLLGRGLSIDQIADKLKLKKKTVESHRDNLRKKLGLKKAHELDRLARESR